MPALFLRCENINLSITYDGLTIYFNKPLVTSTGYSTATSFYLDLFFVELTSLAFYDREITQTKDDHPLYHHDNVEEDLLKIQHCHFKFKNFLDIELLSLVLDLLKKYYLLSPDEKRHALIAFQRKQITHLTELESHLNGDQIADTKTIINHIKRCDENTDVIYLQRFLQHEKFNYLRQRGWFASWFFNPIWQGTNQQGNVIIVAESWAMIEKACALQMTKNISKDTLFRLKVKQQKIQQFSSEHTFFNMKRKIRPRDPKNVKSLVAFKADTNAQFSTRYQKHFNQF